MSHEKTALLPVSYHCLYFGYVVWNCSLLPLIPDTMRKLTLDELSEICRRFLDVDIAQVDTSKRESVHNRQLLHYYAREFTERSLSHIGKRFGGRDHATVLHSIKTVNNLMDTDPEYKRKVRAVKLSIIKEIKLIEKQETLSYKKYISDRAYRALLFSVTYCSVKNIKGDDAVTYILEMLDIHGLEISKKTN